MENFFLWLQITLFYSLGIVFLIVGIKNLAVIIFHGLRSRLHK